MRKKLLSIVLLLSLLAGGTLGVLQYTDRPSKMAGAYSSDRFTAEFPEEPKETSEELNIDNKKIDYHQFSSESKDSTYAVSYVDFPGHWKWLGSKTLLTKAFDKFVESQEGVEEVLEKSIDTSGSDVALHYRLKQDGKEITGKFVVSGNTLYRVFVIYPVAAAAKANPGAFLDSFSAHG